MGATTTIVKDKGIRGRFLTLMKFSWEIPRYLIPTWRNLICVELSPHASAIFQLPFRSLFGNPEHNSRLFFFSYKFTETDVGMRVDEIDVWPNATRDQVAIKGLRLHIFTK